jgi:hypothetical protein
MSPPQIGCSPRKLVVFRAVSCNVSRLLAFEALSNRRRPILLRGVLFLDLLRQNQHGCLHCLQIDRKGRDLFGQLINLSSGGGVLRLAAILSLHCCIMSLMSEPFKGFCSQCSQSHIIVTTHHALEVSFQCTICSNPPQSGP